MNDLEGDMRPQLSVFETGNGGQPGLKPVTFSQRLRESALPMLRDCRGTSLRLATYVTLAVIEHSALVVSGVPIGNSFLITTGLVVPTVVVGELFAFKRLSNRLPWFRVSFFDNPHRDPRR